jgi:hypothetical protein
MGTDKSHLRGSNGEQPEVTWPEVTSVTLPEVTLSWSIFCACATGSCAISSLVGAFWPEVTKSRDRKTPCPEVSMIGSRFCACPAFPRVFLSSRTGCDRRLLDPFGVPLGMHNRKLRNTCSDRRSRDPLGSILGVFSTTSASYNPRKPLFLYLVTGTSLGYLPLLFSYSVYKGCLRSHCGISKSQMVNLIPTCIVSNQKNHPAVLFCLFLCTEASPRLFFINTTVTFIWSFCTNV